MSIESIQKDLFRRMEEELKLSQGVLKTQLEQYLEQPPIKSEWENKTCSEDEFYRTTKNYLLDLVWWNTSKDYADIAWKVFEIARGNVLDFGAGLGTMSKILEVHGLVKKVFYVDMNSENRKFAESWLERTTICSALDDIGAATFDTILLIDTLEHIPDYHSLLDRLVQKLNPEGKIILTFPFNPVYQAPMHHQHFRNIHELTDTMSKHGMTVATIWQKVFVYKKVP